MEEFLHILVSEMEEPGVISWFHFIVLIPIISGAILIPYFLKNTTEKVYKRVLFISWIVLLVLEAFKQIVKSYHYADPPYWEYSYRDFPFSICSMIYYFIPIILFVNKEKHPKIVDAAIGYLCFIAVMAGLVVLIYPTTILGIFIFVWNRKTISIKTFYRSMIAFVITVAIAIIINISFYPHFINMFFINPMITTNLPIGNVVQEKAGYPVFLIGFLSLIALMTFLTYLVETSIYKITQKKKAKMANDQQDL